MTQDMPARYASKAERGARHGSWSGLGAINGSRCLKAVAYLLAWLVPVLIPLGHVLSMPALAVVVFFGVFPLLGWFVGQDATACAAPRQIGDWERLYYRGVPLMYVPIVYGCLAYGAWTVIATPTSAWAGAAMVLSMYVVAACATAIAHELMHHRSAIDRGAARLLWGLSGYGWYQSEHWIHHAHAGDVHTGSTPYLGESVYHFAWRNTLQGMRNAREWESRAPSRRRYIAENAALTGALLAAMAWMFGWQGSLLYAGLCVFCIFVVQAITYIQHYGLESKAKRARGAQIAWRDNCFIGNAMALNINHHSHHHDAPSVPYYELVTDRDAPRLPASYAVMFLVVLVPPLWRALIHPRLARFLGSGEGGSADNPDTGQPVAISV